MLVKCEEVAVLIAVMLKRSRKTRARISEKTMRHISGRVVIRSAFLENLKGELEELEVFLIRLRRGGYGVVSSSSIEGATTILGKDYIPKEVKSAKGGVPLDLPALYDELGLFDDDEEGME